MGEHENVQDALLGSQIWDWSPVVNSIVGTIGFLLTIILLRTAMGLVEKSLESVSEIAIIGKLDTILGVACGGAKGIIWCWVILAAVTILAITGTNTELVAYIDHSKLLTWLQENNLLLILINSFT